MASVCLSKFESRGARELTDEFEICEKGSKGVSPDPV